MHPQLDHGKASAEVLVFHDASPMTREASLGLASRAVCWMLSQEKLVVVPRAPASALQDVAYLRGREMMIGTNKGPFMSKGGLGLLSRCPCL